MKGSDNQADDHGHRFYRLLTCHQAQYLDNPESFVSVVDEKN